MKRSKFLKQMSTALVIGLPLVALTTSCSEEAAAPSPPPTASDKDCLVNGTATAISANHGHSLTVSKNDVENGVDKTYTITGAGSHPHDAIITAADFATLKTNRSIAVTSTSGNGHTHSITVSCA